MRAPPDREPRRPALHPALWYAAIFAIALTVRLAHFWQIRGFVFVESLVVDSREYDAWARRIVGGSWLSSEVFYQAPLYPYFLAAIYSVQQDPWAVRIVQAFLGSAACVLLAGAGTRFFDRRVGIAAGIALALYAPAIYFDGLIQKASLDCFLACSALLAIAGCVQRPGNIRWLVLGLLLGLLGLNRENALVLALVPLAWTLFAPRLAVRARVLSAAALLAGIAVALAPALLHNLRVGGQFVLTTSQAGPNFYIGNNADADGTYRPLRAARGDTPFERRDAVDLAQEASGRELSATEVSSYWLDRAWQFIRAHPGRWLALLAWKLMLVFHATELADAEDIYYCALQAPLLHALLTFGHYGVLVPLAVIGVGLERERRSSVVMLLALVGLLAFSIALFFVFARYRHVMTPALLLLAVSGAMHLVSVLRAGHSRRLVVPLAAAVLGAGVANWPTPYRERGLTVCAANAGRALLELGRLREAQDELAWAVEIDPRSVAARVNLAMAQQQAGRHADALAQLEAAAGLAPADPRVQLGLGIVLNSLDRCAEAVPALEAARAAWPSDPHVFAALAEAYWKLGDKNAASEAAQRSVGAARSQSDAPLAARLIEHFRQIGINSPGANQIPAP